jgi:hypothetical protein
MCADSDALLLVYEQVRYVLFLYIEGSFVTGGRSLWVCVYVMSVVEAVT